MLSRASRIALISALLLRGVPAWADAPSVEGAADARRSEAKARFEEGVKAYGERRYADAVRAFQQADAIEASAALSFNIARAYEHLDNPAATLRWYRDYLRRSPEAPNASEVRTKVAGLAKSLAERGVQQVSVMSNPAGAAVKIDGKSAGVTPFSLELPPGSHRLLVQLSGYADMETSFVLEAALPQDVGVQLQRPSASAPVVVPSASPPQAPAARAVPGATAAARPFGVVPWVVLGAGGASLLGAIGFELARHSAQSRAEDAAQIDYSDAYSSMKSRQTTARVLLGVSGALLATGTVLLVLNRPKPQSTQLALAVQGDRCLFSARGSFE